MKMAGHMANVGREPRLTAPKRRGLTSVRNLSMQLPATVGAVPSFARRQQRIPSLRSSEPTVRVQADFYDPQAPCRGQDWDNEFVRRQR